MRLSLCFVALSCAFNAFADPIKVRLNPAGSSASAKFQDVSFTLSAGDGNVLKGSSYKMIFTRMLSVLGERIVGEGISTEDKTGKPITLSISGLPAGDHTLLTFHNAWDALKDTTKLTISVNDKAVLQNQAQTIRVDNVWQSASSYVNFTTQAGQTVNIKFAPIVSSSITDNRAFLNGFEVDTANVKDQASFPTPNHRDEHIAGQASGTFDATWKAPSGVASPSYDVYFGKGTPSALQKISSGQTGTTFKFSGLTSLDTYYWRVDVVSAGKVNTGRIWTFRLRQLAFPGAEGWGRFARGGRGGKIVKVTSLEDYSASETPKKGTLRYALLAETGPRTIVFDIGGVITLTSRLTISGNFITVAGQTAPGRGIAVQGWPVGLSGSSDVIIQHLRVRPGTVSGQTIDGMGMQGSNHAIMDRISVGWSIDESFSSRSAYNITLQRSLISEPLNVAGHQNYPEGTAHGYAASIGGDVGSFHHNLIAHAYGRSWSMAGGVDAAGAFAGKLDIRNNVVYNFGTRVTDGGANKVNFVGNYYKPGPSSKIKFALKATYEDAMPGEQTYHCAGNAMPGSFSDTSQQVVNVPADSSDSAVTGACWARISISPAPSYKKFYDQPFFDPHVTTHPAPLAYKIVTSTAGSRAPMLDTHDARIVNETLAGTTTYVGSKSGLKGIIDSPADVGGLEPFPTTTRPATWDADNDGIADWWDGSNGGDAGWTDLDGYLQFMAGPRVFVKPGGSVDVDLRALSRGFVEPCVYRVEGRGKGSVSVSGKVATYKAPGSGPVVDGFTFFVTDAEGSKWDQTVGVAVFEGA